MPTHAVVMTTSTSVMTWQSKRERKREGPGVWVQKTSCWREREKEASKGEAKERGFSPRVHEEAIEDGPKIRGEREREKVERRTPHPEATLTQGVE